MSNVRRVFGTCLLMLCGRYHAGNTIVVSRGDNSMAMPQGKGSLYDQGINGPLLIRWSGVVSPGSVTGSLISGGDFAPTLLAVAGGAVPKD